MPITRKQFELGIDIALEALMKKIHSYLSEHRTEAFARDELAELVLGRPSAYEVLTSFKKAATSPGEYERLREEDKTFDIALDKLVSINSVAERKIRDSYYYSYSSGLQL